MSTLRFKFYLDWLWVIYWIITQPYHSLKNLENYLIQYKCNTSDYLQIIKKRGKGEKREGGLEVPLF